MPKTYRAHVSPREKHHGSPCSKTLLGRRDQDSPKLSRSSKLRKVRDIGTIGWSLVRRDNKNITWPLVGPENRKGVPGKRQGDPRKCGLYRVTTYQSLFINCDKMYPAASVYVYLKSGADVIRKVLKTIKQQATQPSHRGADSGRRGRGSRLRPRAGERAKRRFK